MILVPPVFFGGFFGVPFLFDREKETCVAGVLIPAKFCASSSARQS